MQENTRKIVLYIASSADAYIAGPNHEIDWLYHDQDYGYQDFYNSIDTTLMGMLTYQKILDMGGDFHFPDKTNYVFTKNSNRDKAEYVNFVHENIVDFVKNLKSQDGKDIWLVGGGVINTLFLNNKLIDKIVLSIHPIIVGNGIPLFTKEAQLTHYETKSSSSFNSGLVQIVMELKK